jgi:hypothetical protein
MYAGEVLGLMMKDVFGCWCGVSLVVILKVLATAGCATLVDVVQRPIVTTLNCWLPDYLVRAPENLQTMNRALMAQCG